MFHKQLIYSRGAIYCARVRMEKHAKMQMRQRGRKILRPYKFLIFNDLSTLNSCDLDIICKTALKALYLHEIK